MTIEVQLEAVNFQSKFTPTPVRLYRARFFLEEAGLEKKLVKEEFLNNSEISKFRHHLIANNIHIRY